MVTRLRTSHIKRIARIRQHIISTLNLAKAPMGLLELQHIAGNYNSIQRYMQELYLEGLVDREHKGNFVFYSLKPKVVVQTTLDDHLQHTYDILTEEIKEFDKKIKALQDDKQILVQKRLRVGKLIDESPKNYK